MRWLCLGLLMACNPTPAKITNDAPPPAVSIASATPAPLASTAAPAGKLKVIEAGADSDATSLIRTERLMAKADNRVLVVYLGATWCPPCKRFKAEIASGRLDDRLSRVNLLVFDADKDSDRLKAAGYTSKFIPYVALPAPDGSPSDSKEATGKGASAWEELMIKLDAWQKT